MGAATLSALEDEQWDYVILQGLSYAPVVSGKKFLRDISRLCKKVRENGAVPILYSTWAYKKGSRKMASMGISYKKMYQTVHKAYQKAGKMNRVRVADVGNAFYKRSKKENLYNKDGQHPNKKGSKLAAKVFAKAVKAEHSRR